MKSLKEPNLVAVFVGIILGLALGAIPIAIPCVSTPVKLGLAGGPIIVGILIGTFGPRMHMVTYTTRSANLMLRALGLSLYLACLGLDAGAHFIDTVFRPEGLRWIAVGCALTVVPVLIMGVIAFRWMKVDFGSVAGMLCGSMANPMALNYVNDSKFFFIKNAVYDAFSTLRFNTIPFFNYLCAILIRLDILHHKIRRPNLLRIFPNIP